MQTFEKMHDPITVDANSWPGNSGVNDEYEIITFHSTYPVLFTSVFGLF